MSEKDCRNDCTTPLRFPRRPGTHLFVSTGEDCFCCEPNEQISADNRPALPRFNYRIGTYANIREFLLHRINHAPNLRGWTHREADDPAIALLEGAAILGDILTFYQETYANEAFLRTAQWRESIADLVRLLGYRLSPALGGNATFAFELKKDEAVTIPAGFPVKATLDMVEKPAEFETKAEITAYPWLSRFNLFRPLQTQNITSATNEFYISNPNQFISPIEIKAGDRLMIGESDASGLNQPNKLTNSEIVIVDSIRELHGTKIFKIKGNLKFAGNAPRLAAYKLGRAFHHFGYNSPLKIITTPNSITSTATYNSSTRTTTTTASIAETPVPSSRTNQTTSDSLINPNLTGTQFPIDAEVPDLPGKVPIIIQAGFKSGNTVTQMTLVRTITNIKSVSQTWGAISATVSLLELSAALESSEMQIRDALFQEVTSPLFTIKATKIETTAANGDALSFYGTFSQVQDLKARRIMIDKTGKILTVASVPSSGINPFDVPQLYQITVSENLTYTDFPNENPLVTIYGNLADADEGKTLPEAVLGNGDNTTIFQTFKLPKSPLTYHLKTANTPPETSELEIYVGGRLWQKVENFFGRAADEEIYIVREDAENNSWVQFGDGKTGSRLPTGVKNVSAIYRIGAGAFGELKADTKVQASAKLKNLDKIQMPQAATGGTEAESGENAKNAAPGKIQSLGRLVSLRDFETETAAMPGVALVSAAWSLVENIPSVVITVLMETGRSGEIASIEETLNGYNSGRGASRFPIKVVPGKRLYIYVAAEYALDATFRADLVEPEIRKILGVNLGKASNKEDQSGLFSLRNRRFGGREYASTIEGKIQSAAGVIWARVSAFSALSDADDAESIALPGENVFKPIVLCSDGKHIQPDSGETVGHILSLYDKHLFLTQTAREGN